ncbi:MAG: hypothetical protein ACOZCL_16310, partial [Bacillota bacterium]
HRKTPFTADRELNLIVKEFWNLRKTKFYIKSYKLEFSFSFNSWRIILPLLLCISYPNGIIFQNISLS